MSTDSNVSSPATPEPSDLEVVEEIRRGNREMFEVLVRRYNQRLFRVGLAYLHRREAVEDAMQNAYLKAYLNLGRFQQRAGFSTWLTRIMINECLMVLRRERLSAEIREQIARDAAAGDLATDYRHAAAHLHATEMKDLLEQTIRELPENYRVAYMLCAVQQLELAEAAECLGISVGNLKVRLHRAREAIKSRLLESSTGLELFPFGGAHCDALTARVMAAVSRAS